MRTSEYFRNVEPPFTENAIIYTVTHILKTCGILNVDLPKIDVGNGIVTVQLDHIKVELLYRKSNLKLLLFGLPNLRKIASANQKYHLPILLDQDTPFIEYLPDRLRINGDILSMSFLMLSRYEEIIIKDRDQYGRFQYKNSIAAKYGFVDLPIVDEYSMLLKRELERALGTKIPTTYQPTVTPTHDIDFIRVTDSFKYFLQIELNKFRLKHSVLSLLKGGGRILNSVLNVRKDICTLSIGELVNISKYYGYRSEFYFMSASPSKFNSGYNPSHSSLESYYKIIKQENMLIGAHFGFDTYLNPDIMNDEKKRLELVTGQVIEISRQHYLRMQVPDTVANLEAVGITYDTTLGYAEQEGFRCGTCHSYHFFDITNDRPSRLIIRPLIVMDVTLIDYKKYSTSQALEKLKELYQRCGAVGGEMILLWHNTTLISHPEWTKKVYQKFLEFAKQN